MVMPPIGRCFGSCTIPRTVPNTVANAFPISISISQITPIKMSLRTTSPLLEIYKRAVFDRDMVCVTRKGKQPITTRSLKLEEEGRVLRENGENGLRRSQARQNS